LSPLGANGKCLKSTEKARLKFWIRAREITFDFYVVEQLAVDVICGMDFILYSEMDMSPHRRVAYMGKYECAIALLVEPQLYRKQLPSTVTLVTAEPVEFPPGHERFLRVASENPSLPKDHDVDGLALASAIQEMHSNLRLAEAVVNLENGYSTVRLGNFTEDPVRIPAGTPVAEFYPGTTTSDPHEPCFLCLDVCPPDFELEDSEISSYKDDIILQDKLFTREHVESECDRISESDPAMEPPTSVVEEQKYSSDQEFPASNQGNNPSDSESTKYSI